jgi:beta-1,2-mannosidase
LILLLHDAAVKYDDGSVRYTCGQLLIDPARPTEIMAQMSYPWLEPTTQEDQSGLVSNVTFVAGLVHFRGTWFAYYGQSDSTLAVATYEVGRTYGGSH